MKTSTKPATQAYTATMLRFEEMYEEIVQQRASFSSLEEWRTIYHDPTSDSREKAEAYIKARAHLVLKGSEQERIDDQSGFIAFLERRASIARENLVAAGAFYEQQLEGQPLPDNVDNTVGWVQHLLLVEAELEAEKSSFPTDAPLKLLPK